MASAEGMDLQDPLRLRLMSHLQCFMNQRELSARATPSALQPPISYSSCPPPFPPIYPSAPHHQVQNYMPQGYHQSISPVPNAQADSTTPAYARTSSHYVAHPQMAGAASYQTPSVVQSAATETTIDHHQGATYIELTNSRTSQSYPNVPFSSADAYGTASNAAYNNNSSKPYRPWGAEMAY